MRGEIMEISNKTLVWIVVATIVVSALGTILTVHKAGFEGYATSNMTGNASVTIASQTVLRFAIGSLNFGSGSVLTNNSAGQNAMCNLTANASTSTITVTPDCSSGFSTTGWSLVLENAGNTFLNISINFSTNETTFPGGAVSPYRRLKYTVGPNETGSCPGAFDFGLNVTTAIAWTDVTTPGAATKVCGNLSWLDNIDTIRVGIQVGIPTDADGTKSLLIGALGTSIP
jgi:hypothetical protein